MRKEISIVIPYLLKDNEYYLWTQIRDSSDELRGLREFPGGKVDQGESELVAGKREVLEEVGVDLHLDALSLFKRYEFGSNLAISVFLYEDSQGLFEISGFFTLKNLISNPNNIPPNNLIILKDLNLAKNTQI